MNIIFRCIFRSSLIKKSVVSNCTLSTSSVNRDIISEANQIKSEQSVTDFYAGKSVFITGGTGFIGRLLIERLLYTCQEIENIYILMREKKNASLQQRLQELIQNPIFTKLKEKRPQDLSKIVPIAGDVRDVRLGINQEDERTLIDKVSVIFHSAADVKFRSPVLELMNVNYEGTKKVLELGKKITNLDVFVYVSTAFHNFGSPLIDEAPIPPPRRIDDVYKVIGRNDPDEIRSLMDKWGNSYVFTKKMAEAYVASNHGSMSTVIMRPSMVTGVYREPLAGYTDSWVAGTVLLCDVASGVTRVVEGRGDIPVEIIPADYVCNFLIVAASRNAKSNKCNVYNLSTSQSNPISWRKISKLYIKEGKKHGYGILPYPSLFMTKSTWAIPVLQFLTQILPAFAADIWLRLTGREPRYVKLTKTAISRAKFILPVSDCPWDIKTTEARKLISTLDTEDREAFPCDPVTIDWDEYVPIYCRGVKQYMLGNRSNGKK